MLQCFWKRFFHSHLPPSRSDGAYYQDSQDEKNLKNLVYYHQRENRSRSKKYCDYGFLQNIENSFSLYFIAYFSFFGIRCVHFIALSCFVVTKEYQIVCTISSTVFNVLDFLKLFCEFYSFLIFPKQIAVDKIGDLLYNYYRKSKRQKSLFAAAFFSRCKKRVTAFCFYTIVTEIDKFPFEIC